MGERLSFWVYTLLNLAPPHVMLFFTLFSAKVGWITRGKELTLLVIWCVLLTARVTLECGMLRLTWSTVLPNRPWLLLWLTVLVPVLTTCIPLSLSMLS